MEWKVLLSIILDIIKFIGELTPFGAVLSTIVLAAYLILNLNKYNMKVVQERYNTTERVMSYVERQIEDIIFQAKSNAEYILLQNGEFTDADAQELLRYTDRMTLGFDKAKHKIKHYLRINGYYHMYKDKDSHYKILEELITGRGKELRRLVNQHVELAFRSDSPLLGKYEERFREADAIEIYRGIVSRHVSEIKHEEKIIHDTGNRLFGKLYKFFKYRHESL